MRSGRIAVLLALLAACIALPLLLPTNTFQFTIVLAVGAAGVGVSLLLEAGLISFGHALYYGVGSYAVAAFAPALAHFGLTLIVIGTLAGGLAALIVGLFMVRYRGVFFAMLNLAISMVAYSLLLKTYTVTGGSDGLPASVDGLFGFALPPQQFGLVLYYISLVGALLIGAFLYAYRRSPSGWGLGAIEDCEIRIEYLGVSAGRLLLQAYVVSGVLAGFGGAVAAEAVGHVAPDAFFWTTSTTFVVIAVLGGRGVIGPFIGAVIYELLNIGAAQYLNNSWEIVLGAVILLIIRFAREGIAGLLDNWRAIAPSRNAS